MRTSIFTKAIMGLVSGLGLFAGTMCAEEPGVLYTMDNAAAGNHVLIFARDSMGRLSNSGSIGTGGAGTGASQGLPSQGSVLLSRDGRWLFVCNAGSCEISVLGISPQGLVVTDKVASGGRLPLSLALRHDLLYVLNAGGLVGDTDNVTGFIFVDGKLVFLPDSTHNLSGRKTGPAQVSFSRDGEALIVTERVTSLIDIFSVGDDGLITSGKSFQSLGTTPFGFGVGHENRLFVSEAAGGAANASSASAYEITEEGELATLDGAVPTRQTAACWLLSSHDGRFVYTANAGSGTLSGFQVRHDGTLNLLEPSGVFGVTGTGSHPTDMVQSHDGRFLYSLNNGNGTITAFEVGPNGSLHTLGTTTGLPTSSAGLAGR